MRKISYAKLQGLDAFIPGIGGLGSTLPPLNKTIVDFAMYDGGTNLILVARNGNKRVEAAIPMMNVQVFVYDEPSNPAATKSEAA